MIPRLITPLVLNLYSIFAVWNLTTPALNHLSNTTALGSQEKSGRVNFAPSSRTILYFQTTFGPRGDLPLTNISKDDHVRTVSLPSGETDVIVTQDGPTPRCVSQS